MTRETVNTRGDQRQYKMVAKTCGKDSSIPNVQYRLKSLGVNPEQFAYATDERRDRLSDVVAIYIVTEFSICLLTTSRSPWSGVSTPNICQSI